MYKNQIRSLYEQLSPGYRRIADYLLNHYQDAAFMTAAEIGRSVQVDTALVVRFAQRLGYPGFPELIADVQEEVKRDLRAVYEPVEGDNAPKQVFRRNLLQDRHNLEYMLQHLDDGVITQVIGCLNEAKRVFVVGEGNVIYLAEAFAMRLLTLGYAASVMSHEFAGQAAITANLKPGDLFIGLSTTGMSLIVSTVLTGAREWGARTVAIVSSLTNPAAAAAELVLHVPVDAAGIMPSWTCIASVLHALTQVMANSRDDLAADWAMRTDHLLKTYWSALRSAKAADVRQTMESYNLRTGRS